MEGFECSVLLEGVSYQFIQDIKLTLPKYIAFETANTLRRRYGGRRGIAEYQLLGWSSHCRAFRK
jgi:hypothetical protein